MGFKIEGLGTATPKYGVAQEDAAAIAETLTGDTESRSRVISGLYRRSGVRFRHSVAVESGRPGRDNVKQNGESESLSRADASIPAAESEEGLAVATMDSIQTGLLRHVEHQQSVTQSFYPPASGPDDRGPSTATRLNAYEKHAGPLAVVAARRAIESAGWQANEVTHLITVSCTGFAAPGIDLALITGCGLNLGVQRTHIGFMGCHGAINGLRVAKAFAEADPNARLLICAVELCSLHQQYGWDPEHIVSNALFADGAAAVVGQRTSNASSVSKNRSERAPSVTATGSTLLAETDDLMGWRIGDHGFEMSLSAQVPAVIERSLREWMTQWLAEHDLTIDRVRNWAIHPGGPKILRSCANALSLEESQWAASTSVLADFGNMSSPTVLFVLERLLDSDQSLGGDGSFPCVMLAFGPGLSIEAVLLR
ncbi:type III polyketide synthase [Roseiconus lacunae]|uniref:type III polyketide synthase n=1 Tax=Roseiconus lacunae TaxID=2605694 RepID=UPI003087F62A|nr:type III polyketide synthase [Stieleria sp. HD01]